VVLREADGIYSVASSKPLEDAAVDCRCAPYVVERANGNPPYVVGGYVYGMEVRPGSAREPLGRIAGNTWTYPAWDTHTGALAVDPSPIGMARHCGGSQNDSEVAQEGL